jgi:transcriptional regulator with XRE-family HTH domain
MSLRLSPNEVFRRGLPILGEAGTDAAFGLRLALLWIVVIHQQRGRRLMCGYSAKGSGTISKIERGQIAIDVNVAGRIAQALDVDLLELFQGEGRAETDTSRQEDIQPPVPRERRESIAFNFGQLEADILSLLRRYAEAWREGQTGGDVRLLPSPQDQHSLEPLYGLKYFHVMSQVRNYIEIIRQHDPIGAGQLERELAYMEGAVRVGHFGQIGDTLKAPRFRQSEGEGEGVQSGPARCSCGGELHGGIAPQVG